MITLVLGKKSPPRDRIERIARERRHDVYLAEEPADAERLLHDVSPSLVVIAGLSKRYRRWAQQIRQSRRGQNLILLIVMERKEKDYLPKLLEAGADDYVLGTRTDDRLHARLAFVEQKIEVVKHRWVAEDQLEVRARQQAAVAELGQRALAGGGVDDVMNYAATLTAETLNVEYCKVLERSGVGDGLRLRAGAGRGRRERTEPDASEPADSVSGLSVAIAVEERSFGVLSVQTSQQRTFTEDDINFLRAIANVLAAALERRRTEEALRDSEAKSRAILETTVDAMITVDAQGRIESFNQAAERIFGYEADDVIGRNVKILMPSPYYEEHDAYMRTYHETGRKNIIGIGREVQGRRKDGSTFPMDLAVSEVQLGDRLIFTGIIRDITERRILEQHILDISDEERRRIGQDLHDGLGQMLTGIGLISQNMARQMEKESSKYAHEMAEITDLIKEADQFARALARGLVPVELEANGLSAALQRLAGNAERLFAIRCTFEAVGSAEVDDLSAAVHVFRIAQEALSNAVKHGKASEVSVTLVSSDDKLRLRVIDNGVGFPNKLPEERGMGVNIMNYRARILGGTLDIRSRPEGGTVITCTVPLVKRERPASRRRSRVTTLQ